MTDEEYLKECMEKCEVEELSHGHRATFMGVPSVFRATGGPNEWTKEMACKGTLLFWALEKRDEQLEAVEFL